HFTTVVIVGGSAFILRNLTSRAVTHDIDILISDQLVSKTMSNYPNMNKRVATFMDQIPYNFEDRLQKIDLPTKSINFVTPSNEDLAVMKLYSWRPNDIEDLTNPEFLRVLDWDLLDTLIYSENEAIASALVERRYKEMVSIYEQYREQYRK
ncbi:MAG: hypothetical protein HUJ63_00055, partial [Enterococcus sp.]|nr:hypothetical protein [Enterococcus sp.]